MIEETEPLPAVSAVWSSSVVAVFGCDMICVAQMIAIRQAKIIY